MKPMTDSYDALLPFPYGFVFDHQTDAVFVMDLQGMIVYANQSASTLFGTSLESYHHYENIFVSEESEMFDSFFQRAVHGETNEFELIVPCETRDNVHVRIKTVPNERDGQTVSVSVYIQAISERKKRESDMLPPSQELCQSFLEFHRDPILLLDLDATIVFGNPAFSRLLGWRNENTEGYPVLRCPSLPPSLVKPLSDYYQRLVALENSIPAANESDWEFGETVEMTVDGKECQMLLSIMPIHDSTGSIRNWAVHLRNVEQPLSTELSKLEHLHTVSQLAASISHEVRNPLTVTRGFIQLLRDPVLTEEKKSLYIQLSLHELERAERMITDYLSFAKPSLEHLDRFEVNQELDYIVQIIKPYASMRDITVHINKEDRELWISGDHKKFHQSFINIIKNGIEAMDQNGELTITSKQLHDHVLIEVQDTGKGMDAEQLKKLGTPFYTTKDKGTGLGAMVAFSIIREMEGEIEMNSEVGKGTCISVLFPLYTDSGSPSQ